MAYQAKFGPCDRVIIANSLGRVKFNSTLQPYIPVNNEHPSIPHLVLTPLLILANSGWSHCHLYSRHIKLVNVMITLTYE